MLTQTVINQTRTLSDLRENPFYDDNDIGGFLVDAAKELGDDLISTYEHYFSVPFDFTLMGGVGANTVALPDDFQQATLLVRNPTLSTPERVPRVENVLERYTGNWANRGRRFDVMGNTLEVLSAASAAGNYRLLYTPQLADVWPAVVNFTVDVASPVNIPFTTSGGPGPGRNFDVTPLPASPYVIDGVSLTAGATDDPPASLVLLPNQTSTSQNGLFRCAETDPGGTKFFRLEAYDETSELAVGTTVLVTGGNTGRGAYRQTSTALSIDVSPLIWTPYTIPQPFIPWILYLKLHAAIAIRQGRRQSSDDLAAKMAVQKQRVAKLAANRTEEVTQAPITRRNRVPWWGVDNV